MKTFACSSTLDVYMHFWALLVQKIQRRLNKLDLNKAWRGRGRGGEGGDGVIEGEGSRCSALYGEIMQNYP